MALNAPKGINRVTDIATRVTTVPDLPIGQKYGVMISKTLRV